MDTIVKIRNSLICFYNQPGQKSIACEGNIDFHINKGCIQALKDQIQAKLDAKQRSQKSQEPAEVPRPITDNDDMGLDFDDGESEAAVPLR